MKSGLPLVALLLGWGVGCSTGGGTVAPPTINVEEATAKALELYDKDTDGLLSKEELQECPGILSALPNYDSDRDGQVSSEELSSRLEFLYSSGVGLMDINCTVALKGKAYPGATVRFVPEEFLGDAVQTAHGITSRSGSARMAVPDDKLPEGYRGLNMMQIGIFRVEIELEPGVMASSKQPLGYEVAPLTRSNSGEAVFNVSRK